MAFDNHPSTNSQSLINHSTSTNDNPLEDFSGLKKKKKSKKTAFDLEA